MLAIGQHYIFRASVLWRIRWAELVAYVANMNAYNVLINQQEGKKLGADSNIINSLSLET
jgi:hypothetical protein